MKVNIYIDDCFDPDFSEHQLNLDFLPAKDDSFYFDGVRYLVTDREFYVRDRLSESNTDSVVTYNLYLIRRDK